MRLLLNMGSSRGMGSGNVGVNLLREFAVTGLDEVVAFVPESWPEEQIEPIRERATVLQAEAGMLHKLIGENLTLRELLRRHEFDALFSLTDTSMVHCPVPHLLLVQQPFLAYGPDEWDFSLSPSLRWRIRLMERYFKAGLPTVRVVTVQTQAMGTRMAKRWRIPPGRIKVVPSALPPEAGSERWDPDRTTAPYVLYPAHGDSYKNHSVLPAMLGSLASHGAHIRCFLTTTPREVPGFHDECERRGVLSRVHFLGRVTQEQVRGLLRGAIALVNPSKMESFGLTYYEAMAVGCPVIAADKDFAREACGEAAFYCGADSGPAFAQAVKTLLDSPAEGARLSRLGLERFRSASRSWQGVVEEYRSLLTDLVGGAGGSY